MGPKFRLLGDLIRKSKHQKKAELITSLNKIDAMNERVAITHGYLWSDDKVVKFIERKRSGKYTTIERAFTLREFKTHVGEFGMETMRFYELIAPSGDDFDKFSKAVFSRNHKSKTSPSKPDS